MGVRKMVVLRHGFLYLRLCLVFYLKLKSPEVFIEDTDTVPVYMMICEVDYRMDMTL